MTATLERLTGAIAVLFAIIGGLALVVLCVLTVLSVFYRYVLNSPIQGVEDLSTMTLALLVAGSVAWAATRRGHVAVNILPIFVGRGVSRLIDLFARFLSLTVLLIVTYALFDKGSCGMPCGDFTPNIAILHWPFYYVLGAAMALYALVIIQHIMAGFLHWSGTDPNEVAD